MAMRTADDSGPQHLLTGSDCCLKDEQSAANFNASFFVIRSPALPAIRRQFRIVFVFL